MVLHCGGWVAEGTIHSDEWLVGAGLSGFYQEFIVLGTILRWKLLGLSRASMSHGDSGCAKVVMSYFCMDLSKASCILTGLLKLKRVWFDS